MSRAKYESSWRPTATPGDIATLRIHDGRRKPLLVVVGPTAVGKSAFALDVAERLGGEIVSADSRQIYRRMDIGTAKPTAAEQARVRHHVIDVVDPDGEYTLAHFQADATAAIADIHRRGTLPLLVGGTGLYIRAVVDGLVIPRAAPDPALRAELEAIAAREGVLALHARLRQVDPVAGGRIHPNNVRRVIRALEVYRQTGKPFSQQQRANPSPYEVLTIGLTVERAELYRRIDARVDAQIAAGLVEENRRLAEQGYSIDLPSMTGLGYRQIQLYVQGRLSLEEAVQLLKYETHRFARQQYTWFRLGDARIRWCVADASGLQAAADLVRSFAADRSSGVPVGAKPTRPHE